MNGHASDNVPGATLLLVSVKRWATEKAPLAALHFCPPAKIPMAHALQRRKKPAVSLITKLCFLPINRLNAPPPRLYFSSPCFPTLSNPFPMGHEGGCKGETHTQTQKTNIVNVNSQKSFVIWFPSNVMPPSTLSLSRPIASFAWNEPWNWCFQSEWKGRTTSPLWEFTMYNVPSQTSFPLILSRQRCPAVVVSKWVSTSSRHASDYGARLLFPVVAQIKQHQTRLIAFFLMVAQSFGTNVIPPHITPTWQVRQIVDF